MSEFKRGLSAAALKIIEFIRRESESNYAPPMGRQQLMGRKPLFRTRRNGIGTPSPEPDSRRQERTSSPVLELGDYVFHPTAGSRAIFEASPATPKEEPSPILNDESPVMDFIDYAETTGLSQDIFADSQAPAVAPGGEEPSGDPQEGHRKSPQGGGHVFGETGSQVSPTVVGPPTASDRGQVSADQFLSLEIAGYSELVMSDCGLGDSPTDYPPGEGGSRYPEVSPSPHPENGGDTGSNRRVDLEKPLVASPRLVCCQEVDSTRYPYSSSALQPQERNAGIFNAPCLLVDSELALSGPQQNIGLGQATDEETLQLKTPGSYMRGTKLKSASQRANQPLVSVRGPVMTRDPRASQVREVPVDGGREQETTRRPYRLVSEYTNEGDANRAPRRIVLEPPPNRVKPCYGSRLETFSFRDLSHQGSGGEGEASFLRDQLQGTQRKKGRGLGRPRTTRDGGLNKITRYFEKVVKGSGKRTSPGNSPPEGEVAKKCRRSPQAKTLKEQDIQSQKDDKLHAPLSVVSCLPFLTHIFRRLDVILSEERPRGNNSRGWRPSAETCS
ncbi:hypothetical protein AAG570_005543 [Ranatra chinensis]|uniref:Uncharacterized protein n=1 Tax=Ranatra chinensis TaxID=642074 RepID=A0ABD0XY33_9HEMI